jgi:hypothetical protein
MEKRYGISQIFTKEDLYTLSAIGGFDIYKDASGIDWHWVDRATIERRSKYSRSLQFIRHFWLLEKYLLEKVNFDDPEQNVAPASNDNINLNGAFLYRINYAKIRELRHARKSYKAGRLVGFNYSPLLTPELQYPNESELHLLKRQNVEGMI